MKTSNRREVRELAAAIYARLPGKLPITDQNVKGAKMLIEMAVQHATHFYEYLDDYQAKQAEETKE